MGVYKDIDLESKSRRDFIKAGAVFMGGMWFFPAMQGRASPQSLFLGHDFPWFQQPLRIMHTVLRETEAQDYNVDIVTDYVLKSGANALCVNAGGITDFWQNPLPAANLNPFLMGRDILKEISIVENEVGKGKVIYFANQPDVTVHQMGHGDARNVLVRAVNYLVGEENLPKSNAPSSVHMGWTRSRETPGKYVFSLVNTSSAPKRPTRELIPVHQISFRLPLPGQQLISHKILRNQGAIKVTGYPGFVTIEIEKLEDFVAVYLETEYL